MENLEVLTLENNLIKKVENVYGMPSLKELQIRSEITDSEFNRIDLEEEQFVIKQIQNSGVQVQAEPQQSGLQKYLPSFLV